MKGMYMTREEYYDSLQHHGIKGQKWGIRRFQNEDGSLTTAGKNRYNYSGDNLTTRKAARAAGSKAYDEYLKGIEDVERDYKKGQNLTREDIKREHELEKSYNDRIKQINKAAKNDRAAAKKEWKDERSDFVKNNVSSGEKVGMFIITGPFGLYQYNSMRTSGVSAGKAAAAAILTTYGLGPIGNMVGSKMTSNKVKETKYGNR